jgi:hypothetical protein
VISNSSKAWIRPPVEDLSVLMKACSCPVAPANSPGEMPSRPERPSKFHSDEITLGNEANVWISDNPLPTPIPYNE